MNKECSGCDECRSVIIFYVTECINVLVRLLEQRSPQACGGKTTALAGRVEELLGISVGEDGKVEQGVPRSQDGLQGDS